MINLSTIRTINAIIEQDAKDATYKFALLRGAIDICQQYSHLKNIQREVNVYPLGLLAEKWLYYYYPIIAHETFIPQRSSEPEDPSARGTLRFRPHFAKVTDYYRERGGFDVFWNEYTSGNLSEDIAPAVLALLKSIRDTITENPMKHLGYSHFRDTYQVFTYQKGPVIRNTTYPDPAYVLENFGTYTLRTDLCDAFECLGSYLTGEDSLIQQWAAFTHQKSNKAIKTETMLSLLATQPEDKRFVRMAGQVYRTALAKSPIECVWCGAQIKSEGAMHIDHMLPFSRWKNNDLWNLLPAISTVNRKKSDKIPEPDLLYKRKDSIMDYWQMLHATYPQQFQQEITRSLTGPQTGLHWQERAFQSLIEKSDYLINTRGYEAFVL